MIIPATQKLQNPELLRTALHLPTEGMLAITPNQLVYLDVDNNYIHQLFPLLEKKQINMPNYFGAKSAGAHITVIYPEENTKINDQDLHQKHKFSVQNLIVADIGAKKYYVLLVASPSLLQLRRRYGLPDNLCFRGYSIGFHITIGVAQV
ncbi:MAG: hypothetical protein H0U71_02570 [Gammaproteobacteria bacterium]|nr:hypothetical protein [Gammaproteobacteria bacterium]